MHLCHIECISILLSYIGFVSDTISYDNVVGYLFMPGRIILTPILGVFAPYIVNLFQITLKKIPNKMRGSIYSGCQIYSACCIYSGSVIYIAFVSDNFNKIPNKTMGEVKEYS